MQQAEVRDVWKDWRLHVTVLLIVIGAELVGSHEFAVGPGVVILLPMLYAIIIGIMLYFTPVISEKQSEKSEPLIVLGVALLLAKIGVIIGPDLPEIIAAGPALLLQELGNVGTVLIALPVAMLLGLRRETVGMTHSVAREPNVGLIMDKFGFNSPEGRGVMAMYIFGTVFGAIFMGLLAGLLATITPIHPLSFAMASGIGSASMMAAASGSLISLFPEMEGQIAAYAGASNLLSLSTGLYVSIFIALPLTEKLYKWFSKKKHKDEVT